jgi:hypothetical protein
LGVINNVDLVVEIKLASVNNYSFVVTAKNVSLTVSDPVPITLTIGDDRGTTTVTPVIINTR